MTLPGNPPATTTPAALKTWSQNVVDTVVDHEARVDALEGATAVVDRTVLAGWFQDNVVASQAAVALVIATARTEVPMPVGGSLIGIVIRSNAARSAGTLTVDATIDGTVTGLQAALDATNTQTDTGTQAVGADVFIAGQRIGVKITTDGAWAPTTADIDVAVLVSLS